ncbi:MAG TPA: RecX family transcriptional regulator [Candidatus Saccharimonadales bacterium]|nr:RecX family transcriptional regulator [Candidatus Saccharimonadales bacterium]
MKVTVIKKQSNRAGRYSVFINNEYAFSLSDTALLQSGLVAGQELSEQKVKALKKTSIEDKLYNSTLQYMALRLRSKWEIETYLKRKKASPALINAILNKLSNSNLINDTAFAKAYINDRRLLRPTSRRKMISELRNKHVPTNIIDETVSQNPESESQAIDSIINRKRQISKYKDDLKLMQYLARQGFNYGDIKNAMKDLDQE